MTSTADNRFEELRAAARRSGWNLEKQSEGYTATHTDEDADDITFASLDAVEREFAPELADHRNA